MDESIRFAFTPAVSLTEAEMTLHLAMFAVEGLAGNVEVRLSAQYEFDEQGHALVIDGNTQVGQVLARVYAGLLQREFGEGAFRIEREGQAAGSC